MSEIRNSICLTTVESTVAEIMGVRKSENPNPVLLSLKEKKLQGRNADRAVLYNPDAVALWLYQKYTELFTDAVLSSDIALPILSVMPSVTPVCFASMYSGVMPEIHGIKKYVKPVLTVNTIFDTFIKAGKKCAIVSTSNDSISCIFLEREMDYFIYESVEEVNKKALELIDEDKYDLIVIYNGNYDGTMHKFGPESTEALAELRANSIDFAMLSALIEKHWAKHNTLVGFAMDHGCHEIDGECGSHGLDMPEDLNIVHLYKGYPKN